MKRQKLLTLILLASIFLILQPRTVSAQIDPYADSVESAVGVWSNQGNALGAPDQQYCVSNFYDSHQGASITLDMGEGEEIIDGLGDDFKVYTSDCGFYVGVSPNTTTFQWIGYIQSSLGIDNATLDIGNDDDATYRYVMLLTWYAPDPDVAIQFYVDAIEALESHFIPEFPASILLPLFMAITLLATVVYRMKRRNKACSKP